MSVKLIISGFGGQGVLLLGDIIAYSALKEGKNVTWVPSYGPESRGGTCNCQVICSEKSIGSPVVDEPDILIAFNLPSVDKFMKTVKKGGIMLYDSSLVKEKPKRDDIKIYGIPATEISDVANMVMLGAYIELTKNIKLETVVNLALPEKLKGGKEKFIPKNIKAIKKGIEYVLKNFNF